jgi:hypothetical protein
MALNLLFYDSYLYTLLAPSFFESKNWPQIVHLEILYTHSSLTSVLCHLTECSERIKKCVEYYKNTKETESIVSIS